MICQSCAQLKVRIAELETIVGNLTSMASPTSNRSIDIVQLINSPQAQPPTVSTASSSSSSSTAPHSPSAAQSPNEAFQFAPPAIETTTASSLDASSSSTGSNNNNTINSNSRNRLSDAQLRSLQLAYAKNQFLMPEAVRELANETDLTVHRIRVWFQNRRAYERRKSAR
ncbi:hypothetical protein BJ741DRAFT_606866 [Chytriomyces cf. hyalinus JEL632]|nr:hypothetical protein BJ741DRAFT_606866 [Chytriomyces cf. hyalinus JEL632]